MPPDRDILIGLDSRTTATKAIAGGLSNRVDAPA
jgi:hypothetical protein